MKQSKEIQTTMLILVLFLAFMLTNCAPKSSDTPAAAVKTPGVCAKSPVVGKWLYNGDTLILNEDCTGSNTTCNYEFSYPITILDKVHTTITFKKSDDKPNCKKVGDNLIQIELYNKGTTSEVLFIQDGFSTTGYFYMRARE